MKPVKNRQQMDANIMAYDKYLSDKESFSEDLQHRMGVSFVQTQAWFAIFREGQWRLAPTKWMGFCDMTPEFYTENYQSLVRLGEVYAVLNQHDYSLVDHTHPAWARLEEIGQQIGRNCRANAEVYVFKSEDIVGEERDNVELVLTMTRKLDLSPDGMRFLATKVGELAEA